MMRTRAPIQRPDTNRSIFPVLAAALLLAASAALAVAPPEGTSPLAQRAFRHPDLYVSSVYRPAEQLPEPLASALRLDLQALGVGSGLGLVDWRSGSWGTLILRQPLIPGTGKGNTLRWPGGTPPASGDALEAAALDAFLGFLAAQSARLDFASAELGQRTVTAAAGGQIVQIHIRHAVAGVPVRDSFLNAVVNGGNLVLLGARHWGAVEVPTQPTVSRQAAIAAAEAHAGRSFGNGFWSPPHLEIVPVSAGRDALALPLGLGLRHRLVWAMGPRFPGDHGSWEALVDAHGGELVAFLDRNEYVKNARGGIFPVSNDGIGPEGTEQPDHPMPFADVRDPAGNLFFTDSGGDLVCSAQSSEIRTALAGKYVRISDTCGAIDERAADPGDLDLGFGPGTDCAVPPGHSAGDTHSARTGFYEVNRIIEQAKGWLPDNAWLNAQLTSNMNIDSTCNAFWSGSSGTINFYKSGGGCRNTGEIAAVFDHEWGHGMDNNDANQAISSPGEVYADVAAILRLDTSCIGRGFNADDSNCGGNGDPCLACSGVREVDWMKRESGKPHNLDWNQQDLLDPNGIRGGCRIDGVGSTSLGPCGNGVHCEGSMASEAVYDLLKRDLPCHPGRWDLATGQCAGGAAPGIDASTSLEMLTRYYYLAGGLIANWYNCNPVGPAGSYGDGCNADGAYLNFLSVDDDNGDLSDGTPHMQAIFEAFDRHQIACDVPAVANTGCAGRPTTAPSLTVAPLHKGARLTWNAVPGAAKYWVYRTEGVLGCNFGKTRVGETTGTSFTDSELRNGREYFYSVLPVGASDSCAGPISACTATVAGGSGAAVAFTLAPARLTGTSGGDGDAFIDNCEVGTVSFGVANRGEVPLTNVRVARVESTSHPEIDIVDTPTFASSLAPCAETEGTFRFQAAGIESGETVVFRIEITADELTPGTIAATAELVAAESDFTPVASATFGFDTPGNLEGWRVVNGTFAQTAGIGGTGLHLASSSLQDNRCDDIESPVIRLTASSTLSLANQFTIEPGEPTGVNGYFDRANVGLKDLATGARTTISPDGGRLYEAFGPNGVCATQNQPGWAGLGLGFQTSNWSSAALNPGGAFTGKPVKLDVAYGTDTNLSLTGFQFDQVTLTNFEHQGPDAQADVCRACTALDDNSPAVEYRGGWHSKVHPGASNGIYHRRMGISDQPGRPYARVVFSGDAITYFYGKAAAGGTGYVYIDGVLRETLSYNASNQTPSFGHSVTYSGLGPGSHEIRIEHVSGSVFVDGFELCSGGTATASAVQYRSETQASESTLMPVVTRTVQIGTADEQVSVVVEGASSPLAVVLLDLLGRKVDIGGALIPGLPVTGLDAAPAPGLYTVQVLNPLGLTGRVNISIARTVKVK